MTPNITQKVVFPKLAAKEAEGSKQTAIERRNQSKANLMERQQQLAQQFELENHMIEVDERDFAEEFGLQDEPAPVEAYEQGF